MAALGTGGMCIGRCAAAESTMHLVVHLQLDISPLKVLPPSPPSCRCVIRLTALSGAAWLLMWGGEKTLLLEWVVTSNLRVERMRTCNGVRLKKWWGGGVS